MFNKEYNNKEYFEKHNISFANAMKMYDVKKYGTFEQFLYAEHSFEHKFHIGDIIWIGTEHIIYDIDEYGYHTISMCPERIISNWKHNDIPKNAVDFGNKTVKIGHSDLKFAIKLGILQPKNIAERLFSLTIQSFMV